MRLNKDSLRCPPIGTDSRAFHNSQKEEDFLVMMRAVCMAALSFLRALNFLSPVMVSCLCIVDATLSRFYRERERVRGLGWCKGGGEKADELWSIEGG